MKNIAAIQKKMLRAFLVEEKLSRQQFADKHGVPYSSVVAVSVGRAKIHRPRPDTAKILNIINRCSEKMTGWDTFRASYWEKVNLLDADDRDHTRAITLCRPCEERINEGDKNLCDSCEIRFNIHKFHRRQSNV